MSAAEEAIDWLNNNPAMVSEAIEGRAWWRYCPSEIDQGELLAWLRTKNPGLTSLDRDDVTQIIAEVFI